MTKAGSTAWQIVKVADRPGLNVRLVVNTTAPVIVQQIEQAAAKAGIWLVRETPPEPEGD